MEGSMEGAGVGTRVGAGVAAALFEPFPPFPRNLCCPLNSSADAKGIAAAAKVVAATRENFIILR